MKHQLLDLLCCPLCGGQLHLEVKSQHGEQVENGELTCQKCSKSYPIIDCVPRFVPADNYASNFGLQWNQFRQTQLDSHSGQPISRKRFLHSTGWSAEVLEGKMVLDIGCGAGRFAEIALSLGAIVVAVDYSTAVDACWQNLGDHPNLNVVQADLYALPFRPATFDYIYSLGVLQHTPDVKRSLQVLPSSLKPGGELVVDSYLKRWLNIFKPKYWLRPFTAGMSPNRIFSLVQRSVPTLLYISKIVNRIPMLGRYICRLIPVANYQGIYPLTEQQLLEWAILDTFDWLSPHYDQPQTPDALKTGLETVGLEEVRVFRAGHLVAHGRKPIVPSTG